MEVERRVEKRWIGENIPAELKDMPIWVGFKFIPQEGQKLRKEPFNAATGGKACSNNPKTWRSFDEVIGKAELLHFDAIGIGLAEPYIGIDLDHSVVDEVILPWAQKIISIIDSYTEFSPSKTGVHILCKGTLQKGRKFSALNIEMYQKTRFFTVTGDVVPECRPEIMDRSGQITKLFEECEQKDNKKKQSKSILDHIAKSQDAEKFQKLFSGQWQNDYPSQSEADLAFCNKLAFWTGKDAGQMDVLFRQSSLMRLKWDEKHFSDGRTYGQSVIEKAISGCRDVYSGSQEPATKHKLTQGEIITRDCEEKITDFFRDQHGNTFVVLPVEGHLEVCPTSSGRFRNWKATRFRERFGVPPKNEAIIQARIQVEARCGCGKQVELFNRIGWHDGKIYYDLTTPDYRGVAIDENGWDVIFLPPIFRRYQHQAQQVIPVNDGDPKEILRFCNVGPDDHCLFMVAIASFFIPNIPHVIISQTGEQGSGKSNNSRKIKGLGDPSRVMLISTPKDLEQAQMTAEKHWISTFDNISKIHEWFSDFLCRGVTGEGDMKRSLYTNDDEFIRSYRRCFVLNGIGVSMWRGDLLDRAVIFDIPVLKDARPERVMDDEWQKALPGILGGFFTAISKAMRTVSQVTGHEKFRMADFAQWGGALAEVLGYSRDEFFQKYQESVKGKWQDTAEDSVFAKKIMDLMDKRNGYWEGSAAELLHEITPDSGEEKGMPKTAKWLSTELVRIAPVMRNVGVNIVKNKKREPGTGRRIFMLKRTGPTGCEDRCEQGVSSGLFCEDRAGVGSDRPF
jgi:hypothetical protein